MAKKKKHPEHINLERWLISYADFITLLFATFVVLYALSQVDIKDFKALEESIKQAFASPSLTQGSEGIMDQNSNTLFDESQADSMITPLMMEYMSQKYEQQAMEDIKNSIEQDVKSGVLNGVEAIQTDRGLVIRFNDNYLFKPNSAVLTPEAKQKIDHVGALISKKFALHNMRIEGHTDNQPVVSSIYPSNWELSSARASSIIRYLINRFAFMPSLFTSVGFADTRPLNKNKNDAERAKNRRVEILILKNRFRGDESAQNEVTKMNKKEQEDLQTRRLEAINKIDSISEAAKKLTKGNPKAEADTIILNQVYDSELKRISKETDALDAQTREKITGRGTWLKPPAKSAPKEILLGK